MSRNLMPIACDVCENAQATHLARYHAGLLLCKGCWNEEPQPGDDGLHEEENRISE